MSDIERATTETTVSVSATRGSGTATVRVEDAFLGHMLTVLARYGGLDLVVDARGDLRHHLVEDVAIALGTALLDEVPEAAARYGFAVVPMDDALVGAALDVGGRPYFEGDVPSSLYRHFLQSLAVNLKATLHVDVIRGNDRHHVVEAAFKAVGFCLRQAMAEGEAVFSTKGAVELRRIRTESVLDESEELG